MSCRRSSQGSRYQLCFGFCHSRLRLGSISVPGLRCKLWKRHCEEGAYTYIRTIKTDLILCSDVQADISKLTATELAELDAKLWLLSPSCQPYTVLNPEAKGATDPRAKSFIHLMHNVLPELVSMKRHPSHLLVENVAGFEVLDHVLHTPFIS